MKKLWLFLLVINSSIVSYSQPDYSGHYGFQMKVYVDKDSERKPTKAEKAQGRTGDLVLFKIDNKKYKFWLSANRGWPSYNEGDLSGTIEVINNKAIFNKKMEYADSSCHLSFVFYPTYIVVDQKSRDTECGFGMNVYTDGKYNKKNNHRLTNTELGEFYIEPVRYKVTAGKAFLYEDETGRTLKKEYFIKGNIIWGMDEKNDFIYVEHINPDGKFVYGWINKSTVSIVVTK